MIEVCKKKHLSAFLDNILEVSFTRSGHTDYQKKSSSNLESIISEFYLNSIFAETSNCYIKPSKKLTVSQTFKAL